MKRNIVEHDALTGEIIEREMTDDEISELENQLKPIGDITHLYQEAEL